MYIPDATYRVQLHKEFDFSRLSALLPYLHELGISTVYASPVTRALAGSGHGYDVINPLEINPEIGTAEEWESITAFLKDHGMGWLQDIVPNHMAYSMENPWIYDVLERGNDSDFKDYFDIIPQSPSTPGHQPSIRIMVPFLDKDLRDCVQDGQISLGFRSAGFFIQYKNQIYPAAISSYHWICSIIPEFFQPLSVWSDKTVSFSILPWQEWIHFKNRLMNEVFHSPRLYQLATEYCEFINRDHALLHELLSFQHYELCSWKTSFSKMNYRRFFAVNGLICLRMEDASVFRYWHQLPLTLYNQGLIQGFRVDHVDGLFDPGGYLQKLRDLAGPDAYIVSEKILQEDEEIPGSWAVQGTTGYDFLSFVNQLLLDHPGKEKLTAYFQKHILSETYEDMVFNRKRSFLKSHLNGELNNLMRWLKPILIQKGNLPESESLKEALAVLMAAFPAYRIYADQLPLSATDRQWIHQAFDKAFTKAPLKREALDWLKSLFNTEPGDLLADRVLYFLQRWSQYTAPLAAKGTEDTVFYNYNALIGLNEVGDSPARSKVTAEVFHALMVNRQRKAPLSMNASSTHDGKRGEDNRLRINLISLYADEWMGLIEKWKKLNQSFIKIFRNRRSPSSNDEYLIYQALVGVMPGDGRTSREFRERFAAYLIKAMREEKRETQWEEPDLAYEKDCLDFVHAILSPDHGFLSAFMPLVKKVITRAEVFSLSQTLLKLTAPGIPDIYQGAELWDISLVDPDNRLPVDFDKRKKFLDNIISKEKESTVLEYASKYQASGVQKIFLIRKLLQFRRSSAELFNKGQYLPVAGTPSLLAYIRKYRDQQLLIVVPLPSTDTAMDVSGISGIRGRWKSLFSNQSVTLEDSIDAGTLLKEFPVAALILQND
ncbi:MAG: malto-oligosyltrehalose synthase [Bacteroidota bacterium]|nr:malto-oligosyltrehalose synthase [Bacteroidota bacterium]